ncbi:ADP-heptose synthase [Klebsiella michiganensis]|uniref:ADP-heptose synthase n=1 Tax=Klebsiella michiganensis TaxID=1134687 RepID=A0A7H4M5V4_9ENTR|nr:ADP-heptose synthase [Klebsiella michiganensis]
MMLPVRVIRSSACWRPTLASGNTLEEACYFANAAAGVVVGKLGTLYRFAYRTGERGARRSETGFGVMSEEELKLAVAAARKRGEKVVMTNGVFDILHAGHVSYLANARKLGDRLIVAVNSDASTRRLKATLARSTRWISG